MKVGSLVIFCMFYVHDYLSHFMHMLVYMAHACRSDHLISRVYAGVVYVLVYAGVPVFRIVIFCILTQFVCRLASAESKSNLAASLARRNFLFLFGKFERFLQGLKSKFFLT